jgi:GH15 family glucan-1,4-alpha-glucosidase
LFRGEFVIISCRASSVFLFDITGIPRMYRPIGDYGLIGDLHSAALVSKDGSIDYCSLPWLDSPTIFAALLDDEKGGFFSLQPSECFTSEQDIYRQHQHPLLQIHDRITQRHSSMTS